MMNRPTRFSAVTLRVLSRDLPGAQPLPTRFSAVKPTRFSTVNAPVLSRERTAEHPFKDSLLSTAFLGQLKITGQFLQVSFYSDDTQLVAPLSRRVLAFAGSLACRSKFKNSKGEQA